MRITPYRFFEAHVPQQGDSRNKVKTGGQQTELQ